MKEELYQEDIYSNQKTLCFDIEHIFIRKINITDIDEFNSLQKDSQEENFSHRYILVNNLPSNPKF